MGRAAKLAARPCGFLVGLWRAVSAHIYVYMYIYVYIYMDIYIYIEYIYMHRVSKGCAYRYMYYISLPTYLSMYLPFYLQWKPESWNATVLQPETIKVGTSAQIVIHSSSNSLEPTHSICLSIYLSIRAYMHMYVYTYVCQNQKVWVRVCVCVCVRCEV